MTKDQAIEKVRKLFQLSSSSNENEAELALLNAEKIMRKFSIQESDLVEGSDITEKSYLDRKAGKWEEMIADCIAGLFFCVHSKTHYFDFDKKRRATKHHFIGLKTNILTCEEVYSRLVEWVNIRALHSTPGKGKIRERNRYKEGIALGIYRRCYSIIEERSISQNSKALVSLEKEIDEYTSDYTTVKPKPLIPTEDTLNGLRDSEQAPLFINMKND